MPELAPRIRRLGSEIVNSYLVEQDGELVIVDAGAPAYWGDLQRELAAIGRSLVDVRAVLLTHAHTDHLGFAERARRGGIPVRVHELDAALARGEAKNVGVTDGPTRPIPFLRFLAFAATRGMLRTPKVREVITYGDGATLDVPGTPRVIHVPGHSAGSAALYFEGHEALFVGDAIVTYQFTTAEVGPRLSPFNADRRQALESLVRIEDVPARLVFPGHGAPWRDGVASAIERARAAG